MVTEPVSSSTVFPTPKLQGRALYESMGSPKTVVAPMVDQSELAWRILSRSNGANLCYTPMFHARLFGTEEKYRNDQFGELDGDPTIDRPLIVQFCGNDPDEVLAAAKHVVGRCDAVDLNLGCPQGIARRGHYGSFLMEDWDLIYKIINKLHAELEIPVTCKIRRYDTKEKTLEYAKMVVSAGAQILTVHARTREMKGQQTGLADWSYIKYLRDNLPPEVVMFANGNILYQEDVERCIRETGVDGVMSAEGNLYNPAIFNVDKTEINDAYPRVDMLLRRYFDIAKDAPGNANLSAMKSHFFKILHAFLPKHIDIRNELGPIKKGQLNLYEEVVEKVEKRVQEIYAEDTDLITQNDKYKEIPYWRCQPYFRVVYGVASNGKVTGTGKREGESIGVKDAQQSKKHAGEDHVKDREEPKEAGVIAS
jgi:tRNA-dihydrouridine synthase 1